MTKVIFQEAVFQAHDFIAYREKTTNEMLF